MISWNFHGDRHFADDGAVVGGIARLDGRPVTVIGIQKGKKFYKRISNAILVNQIQKVTVKHYV